MKMSCLVDIPWKLSTVFQKLKGLLVTPTATAPTGVTGIKLPKLEVPTFDVELIHLKQFWDQFATAVHNKTNQSNAEKIVYFQQALKDGTAKSTIEGLSHSGDNYEEAVRHATTDQDSSRQAIMDAPLLKDGSGKELKKLHDKLQQHLCVLATLGCEVHG